MPIDIGRVVGAELPGSIGSWDEDDVILYHLGVGAGVPPVDPSELAYAYEAGLKVLPSYAVQAVFGTVAGLMGLDGLTFDFRLLLHGEQEIEIHRPVPVRAKVDNRGRVVGVYDKGKAALVVVEVVTTADDGEPLFTNRFSLFLRGEGGFGGDPGPRPLPEPPDRAPDAEVISPTLPQQALLFRLSGDKNPLHCDPAVAKLAGFDQPILHGLCSYGIVCKAVVDRVLDGDVTRVAGYRARFAGTVVPGESIVTRLWRNGDQITVQARTLEGDRPVITGAVVTTGR